MATKLFAARKTKQTLELSSCNLLPDVLHMFQCINLRGRGLVSSLVIPKANL